MTIVNCSTRIGILTSNFLGRLRDSPGHVTGIAGGIDGNRNKIVRMSAGVPV